jgi:hypothetical protein
MTIDSYEMERGIVSVQKDENGKRSSYHTFILTTEPNPNLNEARGKTRGDKGTINYVGERR